MLVDIYLTVTLFIVNNGKPCLRPQWGFSLEPRCELATNLQKHWHNRRQPKSTKVEQQQLNRKKTVRNWRRCVGLCAGWMLWGMRPERFFELRRGFLDINHMGTGRCRGHLYRQSCRQWSFSNQAIHEPCTKTCVPKMCMVKDADVHEWYATIGSINLKMSAIGKRSCDLVSSSTSWFLSCWYLWLPYCSSASQIAHH